MATATTAPSAANVLPTHSETPFRLTLDQYERIVDAGIFDKRDKVHLIHGILVAKMTENDCHATADILCGDALDRAKPAGFHVRPGKPIRIPDLQSKPEPDRSLVRGRSRDYATRSPEPRDIVLVVEVADSSLAADRQQALLYARAQIPAYWIINVGDNQVELHWQPTLDGYHFREVRSPGQLIPLLIDGSLAAEIPVADLLP